MKKLIALTLALVLALSLAACGSGNSNSGNNTSTPSPSEKITISVDFAPDEILGEYNSFVDEYDGYEPERVIFRTNMAVKDFKFIEIGHSEKNANIKYSETSVLYSLDELLPEKPLVVTWLEQGMMPHRGISFLDENNITRYFYLTISGENNLLLLVEFE